MKYELVIARANTYIAFSPRLVDFFTGALQVVKFEHSVCYFVIIDRVHDHKTKLYLKNANKTLNLHFQGKEIAKLGLLWRSIFFLGRKLAGNRHHDNRFGTFWQPLSTEYFWRENFAGQ